MAGNLLLLINVHSHMTFVPVVTYNNSVHVLLNCFIQVSVFVCLFTFYTHIYLCMYVCLFTFNTRM